MDVSDYDDYKCFSEGTWPLNACQDSSANAALLALNRFDLLLNTECVCVSDPQQNNMAALLDNNTSFIQKRNSSTAQVSVCV